MGSAVASSGADATQSDSNGAEDSADATIAGESSESGVSQEAQAVLEAVRLTATTEVLEYSNKELDPISVVTCDNPSVGCEALGKVDLTKVGSQSVDFKLSYGGESAIRSLSFTVRDTKAPAIKLKEKSVSIEQGGSYEPTKNVASVEDPVDGPLGIADSAPKANGSKAGQERFYDVGWYTVEGLVDGSTPGTYTVKVLASDAFGNTASKSFDVAVKQKAEKPQAEPAKKAARSASATTQKTEPATHSYVLNTNTKKFHVPSCRSVSQMKDSNRQDVEMTREDVIAMGYDPCGNCKP